MELNGKRSTECPGRDCQFLERLNEMLSQHSAQGGRREDAAIGPSEGGQFSALERSFCAWVREEGLKT